MRQNLIVWSMLLIQTASAAHVASTTTDIEAQLLTAARHHTRHCKLTPELAFNLASSSCFQTTLHESCMTAAAPWVANPNNYIDSNRIPQQLQSKHAKAVFMLTKALNISCYASSYKYEGDGVCFIEEKHESSDSFEKHALESPQLRLTLMLFQYMEVLGIEPAIVQTPDMCFCFEDWINRTAEKKLLFAIPNDFSLPIHKFSAHRQPLFKGPFILLTSHDVIGHAQRNMLIEIISNSFLRDKAQSSLALITKFFQTLTKTEEFRSTLKSPHLLNIDPSLLEVGIYFDMIHERYLCVPLATAIYVHGDPDLNALLFNTTDEATIAKTKNEFAKTFVALFKKTFPDKFLSPSEALLSAYQEWHPQAIKNFTAPIDAPPSSLKDSVNILFQKFLTRISEIFPNDNEEIQSCIRSLPPLLTKLMEKFSVYISVQGHQSLSCLVVYSPLGLDGTRNIYIALPTITSLNNHLLLKCSLLACQTDFQSSLQKNKLNLNNHIQDTINMFTSRVPIFAEKEDTHTHSRKISTRSRTRAKPPY